MTSTTVPSTLDEYQAFVRKEALKIQQDMGWPDEKLNATLKALGLPEKLVFTVPVEVTGRMYVALRVDDAMSLEEARASIAAKTPDEMHTLIRRHMNTGYFGDLRSTVLDAEPTEFVVGGPDITLGNPSVNAAAGGNQRWCEQYPNSGGGYCSRQLGHEGPHAAGDGHKILNVWDQDQD